ncbi:3',5'-cyclic-AMP phosphodiesterase [Reinekea forsetii]|nr:3',5'-cyclic-AMP phosphodiesterase [Reinekea forsetii]
MERALSLVQITDPHLHAKADGTLLGMNTEDSLKLIVERVQEEVDHIDLILATGDIAQDSSVGAYENFVSFVAPLNAPMRWIPGNHDNRDNMATVAKGTDYAQAVTELGDWVIVMLDSVVARKVYGNLAQDQLDILKAALDQHHDKHILIAFHHHPILMGSQWIDKIGVKNSEEFQQLIAPYKNIRAIVCGHVHQASDVMFNGFRYISTPSTCVQFLPKSKDFGIDSSGPGYRCLTLHPNGDIETSISRIEGVDFKIDYTQQGY